MKKIVECVPNFSEGRNEEVINAIAEAIKNTDGCKLLDVDPGKSTNRTVYTFVGSPQAVVEGALNSARVARKLIDMRKHEGAHPRMGALDVCPFVPVANVTMDECVELSKEFGRRAAEELGIPVYLYEEAQTRDYRKKLPQIREGEYEGFAEKIKQAEWKPDFGPAEFIPEWGATATGARFFLIAYNVNMLGTKQQAHRIALNIREAGRGPDRPGLLKETKAIGWFVDEYNMAQVSINLTNYKVTAPHEVFEECKRQAAELNIAVAGSELVGLIPLEAMLLAADYYIKKENLFIIDEDQKIKLVIDRLGLNSVAEFEPQVRIIEYIIREKNNEPLAGLSVRQFVESISARTSAPGGGSASAAIAAIGAGLGAMVAKLTYGVRKFEHLDSQMREIIPPLHFAAQDLIPMIDADTNAFNDFMEAMRMPQDNDEQKKARQEAMQEGLKKAINVPLKTMKLGDSAWDAMLGVAEYGNIASKSDIEVGARSLEVGIWGAYKNVLINMPQIKDEEYKKETLALASDIVNRAQSKMEEVLAILNKRDS
jgi:glutamate formiminotransferase/formiminotetrahydrofolate cyclodeaminase